MKPMGPILLFFLPFMITACMSGDQTYQILPQSSSEGSDITSLYKPYETLRTSLQRRQLILSSPRRLEAEINAKVLEWNPEFIVAAGEISGQLTKCSGMTTERINRLYTVQVEWLELANLDTTVDKSGVFDNDGFGKMLEIFNRSYLEGQKFPYSKLTCDEYLDSFEIDILSY